MTSITRYVVESRLPEESLEQRFEQGARKFAVPIEQLTILIEQLSAISVVMTDKPSAYVPLSHFRKTVERLLAELKDRNEREYPSIQFRGFEYHLRTSAESLFGGLNRVA